MDADASDMVSRVASWESQIQAAWDNERKHTAALVQAEEDRASLLAKIESLTAEVSVAREDGARELEQVHAK